MWYASWMRKLLILGAAVVALALPSIASATPNECRWSRDGAWHYSPLDNGYYQFLGYVGSNGVTFQFWSGGISWRTAFC